MDDERLIPQNPAPKERYDPSGRTMQKDGYEVLDGAKVSSDMPYRRDAGADRPRARKYPGFPFSRHED